MPPKGHSRYHGHWKRGQKIGNWTVIDPSIIIEKSYAKISCQCDCGSSVRLVSCTNLDRGISTRCADCANSSDAHSAEKNGNWRGVGVIPGSYLNRVKTNAKKRELENDIPPSLLLNQYNIQSGACALTGLPISFTANNASLDRINSSHGYVSGNIQWVHKDVNSMKNGYSNEYFVSMCHTIAANTANPNHNILEGDPSFQFGYSKKKNSNPLIQASIDAAKNFKGGK